MKPTKKLSLFIISGASGVGKSTACEILFQNQKDYVVLESDIWWDKKYDTPADGYREYRERWLTLCANVSQIGMPCVLCGCADPDQFEKTTARGLFSVIHYLAVVCDEEILKRRLTKGRGICDDSHIAGSLCFNRWLKVNGNKTEPKMEILDNSCLTAKETAEKIHNWIRNKGLKD